MARIDDGFPTVIEFGNVAIGGPPGAVMDLIWEKKVKPPGIQGGGANDTTTMRNIRWRTMNSKKLMSLTEMTITVSYDPIIYDGAGDFIDVAMQYNQIIILYWPDGSSLEFWGFLDEFIPGEVIEGAQPEGEIKIIPTNQDDGGAEQAPNYSAP